MSEWIRLPPPEEASDDFWHEYLQEPNSHTICEVDLVNGKVRRSGTHAVYLSDAEFDALARHAQEVKERERLTKAVMVDLVGALEAARTALEHDVPTDCWATGPMTGDRIEDLIVCPGCWAIAKIDYALLVVREASGE